MNIISIDIFEKIQNKGISIDNNESDKVLKILFQKKNLSKTFHINNYTRNI